jgi:hypothetical protein
MWRKHLEDTITEPTGKLFSLVKRRQDQASRPPLPTLDTTTETVQKGLRLPYPTDAGLMAIKPGDVIMTRSMFDFLANAIEVMPGLEPDKLYSLCRQLSSDLRELVK